MAAITSNAHTPASQLRPLNILRDLPTIANLVETCFADTLDDDGRRYLQQMRRSGKDSAFLRWASHAMDTASLPLTGFVWEEAGEIIGNVSLIPYRHNRRKYYLIANVAVSPAYRRRGIGRDLTQAAIDLARQKHADEIWLQVRDDNPGAILLYQSLGFVERARRTSWRITLDRRSTPTSPTLAVTRRRTRDWPSQEAALRRTYPEFTAWYQPLPWASLKPGFLHSVERFLFSDDTRHWTVTANKQLVAALTWQPMPGGHPDRLWAALPPAGAEEALRALLLRACRDLSAWRTSLALETPDEEYAGAIQAAGFQRQRTLLWMKLEKTG
jgi:ribosomal protein S18 acetylase RimI-like enzyme